MSKKMLYPVIYLEKKNFDENLKLKNMPTRVVLIMIQADYCGYCTQCKPDFENFAQECLNNNYDITVATIQTDDEENNMEDIGRKINDSEGVPSFIIYIDGKKIKKHTGARTKDAFLKFYQDNI